MTLIRNDSPDGTKNVDVIISGNEEKGLLDTNGNPLKDDAKKILGHELVGHAIPATVGTDTGNAVENENRIRKDLKEPLREVEVDHDE